MNRRVAAADIGGSKIEIWVITDGKSERLVWPTAQLGSFKELIESLELTAGPIDKFVVAGAGRQDSGGKVRLTNVDWAPYQADDRTLLANDVQCAALGLPLLKPGESRALTATSAGSNNAVVVTLSTGINSAFCDASGRVHPAETGHVVWQPWNTLSAGMLKHMQSDVLSPLATVKDILSGNRGFETLYNYLSMTYIPSLSLQRRIRTLREQGQGIGPAITQAAIEGDGCAVMCLGVWGPILGQYLRTLALAHLPAGGTIYLTGGIAYGAGVMDYVLDSTMLIEHLYGNGAKMHELIQHEVALRLVATTPNKPSITLRGALKLAAT